VDSGIFHSCAIVSSVDQKTEVKCWGLNNQGQLGLGDTKNRGDRELTMGLSLPSVDLGTDEKVIDVVVSKANSTGLGYSCALFLSGKVKCWGNNRFGQLGIGDLKNRGEAPAQMGKELPFIDFGGDKVAQISVGYVHTCALFLTGKVKCWGLNNVGQLGQGNQINVGEGLGQLAALKPINFGTDEKVIQIASAFHDNCAVFESGRVKCWGYNLAGSAGLGDRVSRGISESQMGSSLPFIDLGVTDKVRSVSLGMSVSCVLLDTTDWSHQLKCWGEPDNGQLGLGMIRSRGGAANEMGASLPYVNLGLNEKIKSISLSASHACALTESGVSKCWGRNQSGELGVGDAISRGTSLEQMGEKLPFTLLNSKVSQLVAGYTFSCGIIEGLKLLKCWGNNSAGSLGYGDLTLRGTSLETMGDNLEYVDLGD
jgi:alpha-tubulin suppressor-like RCC1 family protein